MLEVSRLSSEPISSRQVQLGEGGPLRSRMGVAGIASSIQSEAQERGFCSWIAGLCSGFAGVIARIIECFRCRPETSAEKIEKVIVKGKQILENQFRELDVANPARQGNSIMVVVLKCNGSIEASSGLTGTESGRLDATKATLEQLIRRTSPNTEAAVKVRTYRITKNPNGTYNCSHQDKNFSSQTNNESSSNGTAQGLSTREMLTVFNSAISGNAELAARIGASIRLLQ